MKKKFFEKKSEFKCDRVVGGGQNTRDFSLTKSR